MAAARDINPEMLKKAKEEWEATPRGGGKCAVVKKWAKEFGVSRHTLQRSFAAGKERKPRRDKGARRIPEIEQAARVVAQLKAKPPEHRGVVVTEDARDNAVRNGLIDERFAEVPAGTFDRVLRELGLNPQSRRVSRFQASQPNALQHVDASTSNCFYVDRALPDGDFVLKLHRGVKGYKNKPLPADRLRPVIYGLTDDHSGMHCCRYVAAQGECAADNVEFLVWAWRRTADKAFCGVPAKGAERGKLKGDFGPMMRSAFFQEFLERVGVDVDQSDPENKEAHGKIERPWRTMWNRFELTYFMESDWRKFEILLSELNRQLGNYSHKYNARPHRYDRTHTRQEAWERINLCGGAKVLPDDALQTISRQYERTLDRAGVFSIDNVFYEVIGLHSAKVVICSGVFDSRMVAKDLRTGQRYEVRLFVPNEEGEYTAAPKTEYQKVREQAAQLEGVRNLLHTDDAEQLPANVRKLPTRTTKIHVEDPLDLARFSDVAAALREFSALTGIVLDLETRAEVASLIEENGLSRRFVADLASEVERERATAGG